MSWCSGSSVSHRLSCLWYPEQTVVLCYLQPRPRDHVRQLLLDRMVGSDEPADLGEVVGDLIREQRVAHDLLSLHEPVRLRPEEVDAVQLALTANVANLANFCKF